MFALEIIFFAAKNSAVSAEELSASNFATNARIAQRAFGLSAASMEALDCEIILHITLHTVLYRSATTGAIFNALLIIQIIT